MISNRLMIKIMVHKFNYRMINTKETSKYNQIVPKKRENVQKYETKAQMVFRKYVEDDTITIMPQDYPEYREFSRKELISVDLMAKLQKRWDISPQGIKLININSLMNLSLQGIRRWIQNEYLNRVIKDQQFNEQRHGLLGPDLACAHFFTYRGGRIKFKDMEGWFDDIKDIPKKYDPSFKVTKVKARRIELLYEGFDNLIALPYLEELDVSENPIDDWVCDRMHCIFRNTKKFKILNLSSTLVTEKGVGTLVRIPSLQQLIIKNTPAASFDFLDLLILLFTDVNPNCEIVY